MAHLNLVMIHPFRDGNGRMARALQTMVLAQAQTMRRRFDEAEVQLRKLDELIVEAEATGRPVPDPHRRDPSGSPLR
jgi:Fic family protein